MRISISSFLDTMPTVTVMLIRKADTASRIPTTPVMVMVRRFPAPKRVSAAAFEYLTLRTRDWFSR